MRPVRKDSVSGRSKSAQVVLTGPCLRLVMDHRTCPVAILEELDLSGIDRTLGGSVRSVDLVRLQESFSVSFLVALGDLFIQSIVPCWPIPPLA